MKYFDANCELAMLNKPICDVLIHTISRLCNTKSTNTANDS